MKKYIYNYQTITRFVAPVSKHFFLLRCMPCDTACQHVEGGHLFLQPYDFLSYGRDTWGNSIEYGSRFDPHDSFVFVSSGVVALDSYAIPAEGRLEIFRVPSPLTAMSEEMHRFLAEVGGKVTASPLDRALALSRAVHEHMSYVPECTCTDTTAGQAFAQAKGVCQDYAHILIALCRERNIVARYVNGFLPGTGATHAWVEVLDDGLWRGIDPTNNLLIDYGYIKLSHGRDATDCPVNRGMFTGATAQQTEIRVIVEEI